MTTISRIASRRWNVADTPPAARAECQGERILRVFRNINPQGEPRVWRVGERFDAVARRFVPAVPRYRAVQARLLATLHVSKSLRGRHDHTFPTRPRMP